MLVPVNTRDNTDRIRTEYGQNIDRKLSKNRYTVDKTSTEKQENIDSNIDRKHILISRGRVEKLLWYYKLIYVFDHKLLHSVMIQSMGRYNKWDHFWMDESGDIERACAGPCQGTDRVRAEYRQKTKQTPTETRRKIDRKTTKHRQQHR